MSIITSIEVSFFNMLKIPLENNNDMSYPFHPALDGS